MFEQNRLPTLYMTGKTFMYYEIVRSTLLGQCMSYTVCRGMALVFHDLINFLNLLKQLLFLIIFGTSSQIFGAIYLTVCKP